MDLETGKYKQIHIQNNMEAFSSVVFQQDVLFCLSSVLLQIEYTLCMPDSFRILSKLEISLKLLMLRFYNMKLTSFK